MGDEDWVVVATKWSSDIWPLKSRQASGELSTRSMMDCISLHKLYNVLGDHCSVCRSVGLPLQMQQWFLLGCSWYLSLVCGGCWNPQLLRRMRAIGAPVLWGLGGWLIYLDHIYESSIPSQIRLQSPNRCCGAWCEPETKGEYLVPGKCNSWICLWEATLTCKLCRVLPDSQRTSSKSFYI